MADQEGSGPSQGRAGFPFGLRAHDYGRAGARDLAARLAVTGASHIQLAPAKALEEVGDAALDLGAEKAIGLARVFGDAGIKVAILGCYVDLAARDPGKAALAYRRFAASLGAATAFGGPPVATEAGYGGPFRFADASRRLAFMKALARLVESAESAGLRVALEAARGHLVSTPGDMERVLADIGSPALCVLLDPVNLVPDGKPASAIARTSRILEFACDRIVAIHIKDALSLPGRVVAVPPGRGSLDFSALFDLLAGSGIHAPVIIEDCPPSALPTSLAVLAEAGISRIASLPGPASSAYGDEGKSP